MVGESAHMLAINQITVPKADTHSFRRPPRVSHEYSKSSIKFVSGARCSKINYSECIRNESLHPFYERNKFLPPMLTDLWHECGYIFCSVIQMRQSFGSHSEAKKEKGKQLAMHSRLLFLVDSFFLCFQALLPSSNGTSRVINAFLSPSFETLGDIGWIHKHGSLSEAQLCHSTWVIVVFLIVYPTSKIIKRKIISIAPITTCNLTGSHK